MATPLITKLQEAFTVEAIMTPRADFSVCDVKEMDLLEQKLSEAKEKEYDTLPIVENGEIKSFCYKNRAEIFNVADYVLSSHKPIADLIELFARDKETCKVCDLCGYRDWSCNSIRFE